MSCQMGNTLINLAWTSLSRCPRTSRQKGVCTKYLQYRADKGQEITAGVEKRMSLFLAGGWIKGRKGTLETGLGTRRSKGIPNYRLCNQTQGSSKQGIHVEKHKYFSFAKESM